MSDSSINDDSNMDRTDDNEPSFAELLESYEAGMNEDLGVGDKIKGRVVAIDDHCVFVDTGTKADGMVDKEELLDEKGNLCCRLGDELELFVVAMDESEIRLSRAISGIGGIEILKDAYHNRIPIEGKVVAAIKGGFQVEVVKRRAFCPVSQMDVAYVEETEPYIGQTYSFLVTTLSENGRNIVLSRRKLLEQEQAKVRQAYLEQISPGEVVSGTVTRMMPYGAFVQLCPGLEGMVHISELGWSRLDKPQDAVCLGERIEAKVLKIETDAKGRPRISLSVKQATEDPWLTAARRFAIGTRLTGKVTRCADFGAFVEVAPGIEGLVHVSEMSYTRRVNKPRDMVSPGQSVAVMVKAIDPEARRMSLSMKEVEGDPWLDARERFPAGTVIEGVVEKKENFGFFINLAPGITGLLPMSKIKAAAADSGLERLKTGDRVKVSVSQIDTAQRRISLAPAREEADKNWRRFSSGANSSLGSLGEKLQQAMKNKQKD